MCDVLYMHVICVCMCVRVCKYMHVICVCMCMCVRVCMYMHVDTGVIVCACSINHNNLSLSLNTDLPSNHPGTSTLKRLSGDPAPGRGLSLGFKGSCWSCLWARLTVVVVLALSRRASFCVLAVQAHARLIFRVGCKHNKVTLCCVGCKHLRVYYIINSDGLASTISKLVCNARS